MWHGYSPREANLRLFFGNKDQLDVFGAVLKREIEPPEIFPGTDIKEELLKERGVTFKATHEQLGVLEQLSMIKKSGERTSVNEPQHYIRVESPYWSIVEVAISAFAEKFPGE